jgi:hypothetical protein
VSSVSYLAASAAIISVLGSLVAAVVGWLRFYKLRRTQIVQSRKTLDHLRTQLLRTAQAFNLASAGIGDGWFRAIRREVVEHLKLACEAFSHLTQSRVAGEVRLFAGRHELEVIARTPNEGEGLPKSVQSDYVFRRFLDEPTRHLILTRSACPGDFSTSGAGADSQSALIVPLHNQPITKEGITISRVLGFLVLSSTKEGVFEDSAVQVVAEQIAASLSALIRTHVPLVRAQLDGANLEGVNLEGADLEGADLKGANLKGANLKGANLKGANFKGADLKGADLEGANLMGADLEGTDLEGANLRGTTFEVVTGEAKQFSVRSNPRN